MAVSDESGATSPGHKRSRKGCVFISKAQRVAARYQFETGELDAHQVAQRYNVAIRTVRLWIANEGWQKGAAIPDGAEQKLQQLVADRLPAHADAIALKVGQCMEENMAPWFEREKRKWVKESIKIAKAGRKMVRSIVSTLDDQVTPKDAAYIAKSDDIYDNIGRRNLGMSSESGVAGSLNIQVLAGNAAVQVNQT